MFRWALRFFLIRVLPGRLILFMSLADLFFLIRSLRRRASSLASGGNAPVRVRAVAPSPRPAVEQATPPAPPTARD